MSSSLLHRSSTSMPNDNWLISSRLTLYKIGQIHFAYVTIRSFFLFFFRSVPQKKHEKSSYNDWYAIQQFLFSQYSLVQGSIFLCFFFYVSVHFKIIGSNLNKKNILISFFRWMFSRFLISEKFRSFILKKKKTKINLSLTCSFSAV